MFTQNVAAVLCDLSTVQQCQQRGCHHQQERGNEELRCPYPAQHTDQAREERVRIEEPEARIELRTQPLLRVIAFYAFSGKDAAFIELGEKPREGRKLERPAI